MQYTTVTDRQTDRWMDTSWQHRPCLQPGYAEVMWQKCKNWTRCCIYYYWYQNGYETTITFCTVALHYNPHIYNNNNNINKRRSHTSVAKEPSRIFVARYLRLSPSLMKIPPIWLVYLHWLGCETGSVNIKTSCVNAGCEVVGDAISSCQRVLFCLAAMAIQLKYNTALDSQLYELQRSAKQFLSFLTKMLVLHAE